MVAHYEMMGRRIWIFLIVAVTAHWPSSQLYRDFAKKDNTEISFLLFELFFVDVLTFVIVLVKVKILNRENFFAIFHLDSSINQRKTWEFEDRLDHTKNFNNFNFFLAYNLTILHWKTFYDDSIFFTQNKKKIFRDFSAPNDRLQAFTKDWNSRDVIFSLETSTFSFDVVSLL